MERLGKDQCPSNSGFEVPFLFRSPMFSFVALGAAALACPRFGRFRLRLGTDLVGIL